MMDQATANALQENGATLILLDLPEGSEFGIDMSVFRVGPEFRGVKMIPQGVHFVYFSPVSRSDHKQLGPRVGFFHHFTTKELLIRRWSVFNEDLDETPIESEIEQRYRLNLKGTLDRCLAPYTFETYSKWIGLSDYIDASLIERLNPNCKIIKSAPGLISSPEEENEYRSSCLNETPPSNIKSEDLLKHMHVHPDLLIRFTKFPGHRHPEGCLPELVTKYNIDASFVLKTLLESHSKPNDLLGEVQFAFVSFFLGQLYESFDQWKKLLLTFCECDEALSSNVDLFTNFIRVLYFQLEEVPLDIFVDIVDDENFLFSALRCLFSNVYAHGSTVKELFKRSKKFQRYVSQKFKWDMISEPSDEAPTVVYL